MEPITHAVASFALARGGLNRASRLATPMVLVSGLAADLDWLSLLGGPEAFLHGHRTATHSLAGTAAIAVATAIIFWLLGRRQPSAPVRWPRALLVCACGAGAHLLLDLTNAYGVKLLWPFQERWYAWDVVAYLDPWILILLLLGLLIPGLFRLVSEEIGARPKRRGGQRGAILALTVVLLYTGGRWVLHDRALEMLRSRLYRGQTPLNAGAFPESASPLTWAGVVETENALEQVEVPLGPGGVFDPDSARTYFKPEASPVLEAARSSGLAREYLAFVRFPRAIVEKTLEGYRVRLNDVRFTAAPDHRGLTAVIELNRQAQVIHEELRFTTARGR